MFSTMRSLSKLPTIMYTLSSLLCLLCISSSHGCTWQALKAHSDVLLIHHQYMQYVKVNAYCKRYTWLLQDIHGCPKALWIKTVICVFCYFHVWPLRQPKRLRTRKQEKRSSFCATGGRKEGRLLFSLSADGRPYRQVGSVMMHCTGSRVSSFGPYRFTLFGPYVFDM